MAEYIYEIKFLTYLIGVLLKKEKKAILGFHISAYKSKKRNRPKKKLARPRVQTDRFRIFEKMF